MRVSEYQRLSQKNLTDGRALLEQGDYHQASEKYWGAAASAVKAVAESRGWSHNSHRDLYEAVGRIARERAHTELVELFGLAGHLHTNFYEDWLPADQVVQLAARVDELVDSLAGSMES